MRASFSKVALICDSGTAAGCLEFGGVGLIRFSGVDFSYGSAGGTRALAALDLALEPGEMLGVLGANGSGKSTLALLTNGLLLPSAGSVTVDDLSTADAETLFDLRSRVGLVFQRPDDQVVATSVEDDVAFGPENLGLERAEIRRRVDTALADVGLIGLERREPHLLSGGQKQRLAIAGALAMQPRYLVLDEPTSMIDAAGREEVREVLARVRENGRAIMLITHDIAEVLSADRVVVLKAGACVFEGTPERLVSNATNLGEWGLELPTIGEFALQLRAFGIDAPLDIADAAGMVEALWR